MSRAATRRLDVGIVGAGTAGAATAIFLARAGHRVTLYERVLEPGPVGAGIMLQPSGQAILGALGLRDDVVARGARIDRLRCETATRRTILDLTYARLDPAYFGVGLHRGVLFEALFAAARREPIALRLGVDVVRLRHERGDRVSVVDADGDAHGPHDLVVVCDGARSRLRDAASALPKRVAAYPWGALWFVAEDPERAFHTELYQVVRGNQQMLGLLPTGLGPRSGSGSTAPLVSLFWSIRGDRLDAWRDAGLEAWKRQIADLAPQAAPLLAQIRDPHDVLYAAYHDVAMSRWATHDVVILGDAAHATSPQLGQGCNLALVDAWTLARCLEEHPLPDALRAYSAARSDHLFFYQLATRWLTPFFQSDAAWLGAVRDVAMGAMGRVPPFARLMTASMCGVVAGPFARLALP